jgi:hypothetical protein
MTVSMSRELLRFDLRELAAGRTNCQGVERTVFYPPASMNDRYRSLCLDQMIEKLVYITCFSEVIHSIVLTAMGA